MTQLRVALLTREYPPEVYGGAGVHVTYLARELAGLVDLTVHCQGADRPGAVAHRPWDRLGGANPALQTISTDLSMTSAVAAADLVHSHTWYANLAGHLAALLYGVPHVVTMHSLEPLRPWKAEQLGGGYALSSWCERVAAESAAAVVAVSDGMRADVLAAYPAIPPDRVRVIRNGIDTGEYTPDPGTDVLERYGVDPGRPCVVFVGRITRQKGLPVLLRAAQQLDPAAQLVLCAGQPDTAELAAEVTALVAGLKAERSGVIWLPEMLPQREVIQLLTHATVFACPSLYEPLGIVNLEAMACGTAVVASRVGGIPEVVSDGETGLLVPPDDPGALAGALNALLADPGRAAAMGERGRERAIADFSWPAIAAQTAGPLLRAGRLTARWLTPGWSPRPGWCSVPTSRSRPARPPGWRRWRRCHAAPGRRARRRRRNARRLPAAAASVLRGGLSTSSRIWAPGPTSRSLAPNLASQERRTAAIGSEVGNRSTVRQPTVGSTSAGRRAGTSPMGAGGSEPRNCWHSAMLSLPPSGGARLIPSTLAASR